MLIRVLFEWVGVADFSLGLVVRLGTVPEQRYAWSDDAVFFFFIILTYRRLHPVSLV